jgi:hypothetical protein
MTLIIPRAAIPRTGWQTKGDHTMPTTAEVITQAQAAVAEMRKGCGHNITPDAVGGLVAALIVSGAVDRLVATVEKATAAPTENDEALDRLIDKADEQIEAVNNIMNVLTAPIPLRPVQ